MIDKVLLITDGEREIDLINELNFLNIKEVRYDNENMNGILEELNVDYKAVVMNLDSYGDHLKVANVIRTKKAWIPIMAIKDLKDGFGLDLLKNIEGYGITRVFNWKGSNVRQLQEYLTNMIYSSVGNEIAVILPVYNEEKRFENVREFFNNIKRAVENTNMNVGIYFINDGSNDRTTELIKELSEEEYQNENFLRDTPLITLRNLNVNTRKAGTYIEALKNIDADVFVFADADNSFVVEDVFKMVNIIQHGYFDMVAGTKDATAEKRETIRRIMSFAKRVLTKKVLPEGIYDSQTGLKALNRVCAEEIVNYLNVSAGLAVDLEMLYSAKKRKVRVLQLPVQCIDRDGSHVDIVSDSINFLKVLIKLVTKKVEVRVERA